MKSESSDRNITIVEKQQKDEINLLQEISGLKSGTMKVIEDTTLDKRYARELTESGRGILPSLKDLHFKDEIKEQEVEKAKKKAKKRKYLL